MRNDYYSNSKDYINRWVVSYADFVTMLLALFMVMYAMSSDDTSKLSKALKQSFKAQSTQEKILDQNPEQNIEQNASDTVLIEQPSQNDTLYETLKEKFSGDTSLSVVKESRGTIIRINDTMLFDEGSAIIKSEAKYTLEKIASELKELDNPIIIEGHTDSTPIKNAKFPSNWELSTSRATNIIKYLTENKLISPNRLSAVGYGEYVPVDDNSTSKGRAKNRRVDIIVLSNK